MKLINFFNSFIDSGNNHSGILLHKVTKSNAVVNFISKRRILKWKKRDVVIMMLKQR